MLIIPKIRFASLKNRSGDPEEAARKARGLPAGYSPEALSPKKQDLPEIKPVDNNPFNNNDDGDGDTFSWGGAPNQPKGPVRPPGLSRICSRKPRRGSVYVLNA